MHNYLVGNARRIVIPEKLARELINLILCKLYDEKYTRRDDMVRFRAGTDEDPQDVYDRVSCIFRDTKIEYDDVFGDSDSIMLDPESVAYVVGKLQRFSLIEAERDVVADAFEVFIGPSMRGDKGQFFTPRNVVKAVIGVLDPDWKERVIDPACGSGGFLAEYLKHVHAKIDEYGRKMGWTADDIRDAKVKSARDDIRGIEKDAVLSKVAKSYMVILGDGRSGIVTEDALDPPSDWRDDSKAMVKLGQFDLVITNPPFGSKIPVEGRAKLAQFELCHKWKLKGGAWIKGGTMKKQAPQIAFIDRCLDLLKEGGRLGIVLPDGILANSTYGYVRQSLARRAEIMGIVDLPADTFRPSTNTKTHLLFLRKTSAPREDYDLFLSYAMTCGHDKRRRPTGSDDVAAIPGVVKKMLAGERVPPSNLGVMMNVSELEDGIWLPKYYKINVIDDGKKYGRGYRTVSLADMERRGIIKISGTGKTVNADAYGEGDVPFIRTSDIANWEVCEDPTHCVPRSEYERVRESQDVRERDILVVRDGTFLIGKTAMITDLDIEIVLQGHFRKIRVVDDGRMSPYLLLGLLNTGYVRKQLDSLVFTQASISTIGSRLGKVTVTVPDSEKERSSIERRVREIVSKKRDAKKLSRCGILEGDQTLLGYKNNGHQGNL